MDNAIKKNFTKYSGLTVEALEFLVNINLPVDIQKSREVWMELFNRYFNEERLFNLYYLIHNANNNQKYMYFAKAMEFELVHEETVIPVHHAEYFMRNMLAFIEHVDNEVLKRENLQFEWQLHGLAGLKSMLEKIREAKIKDNILRQKINLFIDKINNARKETLLLLEEDKQAKETEQGELTTEIEKQAIQIIEDKKELMKQELQHLNIPLSKTTKGQLLEMLEHIKIYYPEDRRKIIARALKKYYYEAKNIAPFECFIYSLQEKLEDVIISDLMVGAFCGVASSNCRFIKTIRQTDIDAIVPGGTIYDVLDYLSNWLESVDGMNKEAHRTFMLQLYKVHDNTRYIELLEGILNENMDFIRKYSNKTLSFVLNEKIMIPESVYNIGHTHKLPKIKFSKEVGNWVLSNEGNTTVETTVLEYYDVLFGLFRGNLFDYMGHYVESQQLNISQLSKKYSSQIKELVNFHLTITIDGDTANCKVVKDDIDKTNYMSSSLTSAINSFIRHKFYKDKISNDEIRFLYKEHYEVFKEYTDERTYSGSFHEHIEYVAKYFVTAMGMFDFSNEEELWSFFKLPVAGRLFYGKSRDGMLMNKFHKESADLLIRKLRQECPHIILLIEDYLQIEEETYEEFEFYDEFKDLDDMQKLLLMQNGVKIGEERTKTGYKEGNAIYTAEELKNKYLIDYFSKLYGGKKYL